jgi:hypothetical protein
MAQCVTCGAELHPERAQKYDYCTAPECQEKNFKGLTMVAVGMNKAAEEYLILDDHTRADLASGKYRDQRRGSFGPPVSAAQPRPAQPRPAQREPAQPRPAQPRPAQQHHSQPHQRPARPPVPQPPARRPWTRSQEKLALLYNEQGLRPAEIAAKLGVTSHLVTQIILAAKNRGKG